LLLDIDKILFKVRVGSVNSGVGLTPLWLTLKVTGVATLAAGLVGVNLAFLVARSRFWGREGLDSLCTLPLVMPPTVLGYYLIVLIGRQSWLGRWLLDTWGISLIFTWQGAALAAAFEKTHPGSKIICNFAASGVLLQQMDKGAPVDVFAAADQKTMNQAQEKKLIVPDTRKNFVSNRLVLIVPREAKPALSGLKDLTKPAVPRLAVGNPATVPAGRYAKEALVQAGLWEKLSPKFILAESVRQVLDYVSRGEVDAGLVYSTDAAIAQGKVKVITAVTEHAPILYPIAVTASTTKTALAWSFVDFVLSPAAQEIFKKYGFGPA
jgi:molybdate transport system substrate-binding protein